MVPVSLGRYATTRFDCTRDNRRELNAATYALGVQGSGKTTALINQGRAFHRAGDAVLVLDRVGELSADLIGRYPCRYVAPGVKAWGLSLFDGDLAQPGARDAAVAHLLTLFERMGLATLSSMTNVRQSLRYGLYLCAGIPHPTLNDVERVLTDEQFRRRLYGPHIHPRALRHWQAFDKKTPKERDAIIGPTIGRLAELADADVFARLSDPASQPITLGPWLENRELVVVNLAEGIDDYSSRMLANFFLAIVLMLARARPAMSDRPEQPLVRVIIERVRRWAADRRDDLPVAQEGLFPDPGPPAPLTTSGRGGRHGEELPGAPLLAMRPG